MSNLDNARAFYDACEKGEGWAKCKNYCSANAIFRSQGGLYHPPIASEPNLGGDLENYVEISSKEEINDLLKKRKKSAETVKNE